MKDLNVSSTGPIKSIRANNNPMGGDPVRLGLIGAGRWGRIFINTLNRLDGFELVRLASSNPQSQALVGEGCRVCEDWRSVAAADDLDGVIIATPPALHAQMAQTAIIAGNPVLVEKPLTLNIEEAQAVLDIAEQHDAIVHVDHIHLYHPAYRALKTQGLGMGPIHAIRAGAGDWGPFRADTSLLWDRGTHEIALCVDLLGAKPDTVFARWIETRNTDEGLGETIALQLTFADGVRADIDLSNLLQSKKRLLGVHFDRQTLIFDDVGPKALVCEPRSEDAKDHPEKTRILEVQDILSLDQVLLDFAHAIKKGQCDLAGLKLGVDVVEVLTACQQSLREGKTVSMTQ